MDTKVLKQSIECEGRRVNQFSAAPFNEMGNTRHNRASSAAYKLVYVTYASTCSSGSVLPSYLSMDGLFHIGGNDTSMKFSVKGCRRDDNPTVALEAV